MAGQFVPILEGKLTWRKPVQMDIMCSMQAASRLGALDKILLLYTQLVSLCRQRYVLLSTVAPIFLRVWAGKQGSLGGSSAFLKLGQFLLSDSTWHGAGALLAGLRLNKGGMPTPQRQVTSTQLEHLDETIAMLQTKAAAHDGENHVGMPILQPPLKVDLLAVVDLELRHLIARTSANMSEALVSQPRPTAAGLSANPDSTKLVPCPSCVLEFMASSVPPLSMMASMDVKRPRHIPQHELSGNMTEGGGSSIAVLEMPLKNSLLRPYLPDGTRKRLCAASVTLPGQGKHDLTGNSVKIDTCRLPSEGAEAATAATVCPLVFRLPSGTRGVAPGVTLHAGDVLHVPFSTAESTLLLSTMARHGHLQPPAAVHLATRSCMATHGVAESTAMVHAHLTWAEERLSAPWGSHTAIVSHQTSEHDQERQQVESGGGGTHGLPVYALEEARRLLPGRSIDDCNNFWHSEHCAIAAADTACGAGATREVRGRSDPSERMSAPYPAFQRAAVNDVTSTSSASGVSIIRRQSVWSLGSKSSERRASARENTRTYSWRAPATHLDNNLPRVSVSGSAKDFRSRTSFLHALTARNEGKLSVLRDSVRCAAYAAAVHVTGATGPLRDAGASVFRAAAWRALYSSYRPSSVSTKPTGHVADLAFAPSVSSPRLAVGSTLAPCEALIYDLRKGTCHVLGEREPRLAPLAAHGCTVPCVRFSASGEHVLTASYDHTVRVWDASSGRLRAVLGDPVGQYPSHAENEAHGGAGDGSSSDESIDGSADGAAAVAAFPMDDIPDANRPLMMGVESGALAAANAAGHGLEPAPWAYTGAADSKHTAEVTCLATHPSRDQLCVSGGKDRCAVLWNVETARARRKLKARADMLDLAFGHGPSDGALFGAIDTMGSSSGGQLCAWDIETGAPLYTLLQPRGHVSCLHAAARGDTVLYGAAGGCVRQVDAANGREVWTYETGMSDVNLLSLSCDGTYVQASGDTNVLIVLDVRRPHVPVHMLQHDVCEYINGVSASWCYRSRSMLVTGSDDETVRIWDVALGTPEVARIRGHAAPVSIVAVSVEDDLLASGGDEGKVVLYSRYKDACERGSCYLSHEQDNVLMRQSRQDDEAAARWI